MIQVNDILDRVSTKDGLAFYGVHFNNRGFAKCPFHNERTPSFHYDSRKDRFYCFSCHKGGTIIDFVAEYFNYAMPKELPQVLERIDKDFNLGLGKELSVAERKQYYENQKINKILQKADKQLKEEAAETYDKWAGVHRKLYAAYLEIDQKDIELGDLLDQLEEALDDFSGNAIRVWPLQSLTENQLAYIQYAFKQQEQDIPSFRKFQQQQQKVSICKAASLEYSSKEDINK